MKWWQELKREQEERHEGGRRRRGLQAYVHPSLSRYSLSACCVPPLCCRPKNQWQARQIWSLSSWGLQAREEVWEVKAPSSCGIHTVMEQGTEDIRSEAAQGSILTKERAWVPVITFSVLVRTNQVPEVSSCGQKCHHLFPKETCRSGDRQTWRWQGNGDAAALFLWEQPWLLTGSSWYRVWRCSPYKVVLRCDVRKVREASS